MFMKAQVTSGGCASAFATIGREEFTGAGSSRTEAKIGARAPLL
jgi:hypothetical protein